MRVLLTGATGFVGRSLAPALLAEGHSLITWTRSPERAGSILPLVPVVQSTTEATGEHLELHVFPGADGSYELYEDSGLDCGYAQGAYAVIPMRWRERDKTLELAARRGSFPGMLEERRFTVVLRGQEGESVRREIAYAGRRAVIRC
jgi:alpha-D-xyloside xylohydrolase